LAAGAKTQACLIGALLFCAGCATPTFQRRAQNVTVVPARIAVLPALTSAYELAYAEDPKPLDGWATAMAQRLDPEIDRWVVGYRGHRFVDEGATVPAVYPKFRRWTILALPEIAAQATKRADFKLYSVDKWGFNQSLEKVRERLDADFVLVSWFKDTKRTGGHQVAGVIGGLHYYYLQVGIACLVDLQSGTMSWCNVKTDAWGDLSVPANAQKAVGELLTDLYHPPKPVAPTAPTASPSPEPSPARAPAPSP
jgi:hypothetical protein